MRNFTYNGIELLGMCTALPKTNQGEKGAYRAIAVEEQTTADLGFLAAQQIIEVTPVERDEIGVLIFLTKTPDYRGPATAMVLQNRLGISEDCIVYDAPTGNAGFEVAINLGGSLLSVSSKKYALIVFGDTVSKQFTTEDIGALNVQDGATSMLFNKKDTSNGTTISTLTLSAHWSYFMLPSGGFRNNKSVFENLNSKRSQQTAAHLHIDFPSIFSAIHPEMERVKTKVLELMDSETYSNVIILINLLDAELEKRLVELFQSDPYKDHIYLSSTFGPQTMAATIPLMISKICGNKQVTDCQVISVSLGEGLSINIASLAVHESAILESIYSDIYYDNGFVTHEM